MAIVHVLLCELYILSDKLCWKVTFCHSKTSTFVNFTSQLLHHHA